MAKVKWIIPIAGIVAVLIACASTSGAANKEFIKFITETRNAVPKDVIVGFGQASAKGLISNRAYQTAITRARDDVVRQISVLIKSSFVDFAAGAEGDSYEPLVSQ